VTTNLLYATTSRQHRVTGARIVLCSGDTGPAPTSRRNRARGGRRRDAIQSDRFDGLAM